VSSVQEIVENVFHDIVNNYKNHKWLCERSILAPKNENVNYINTHIQNELPGTTTTYKSIDTVTDPEQAVNYPTEFLNSLEPSGMPPHNLALKVGSPILLLRNLDPPKLCNGTRL
jgi:ATP-dependent DNA helicase PIF1